MELKHFFAADMRSAINMVKKELGPEAIIFSQRNVDGGVEIEAAIDRKQEVEFKPKQPVTVNNTTPETSKLLTQMQSELTLLRNMLQHQVSGLVWQEKNRQSPETTWVTGKLKEMGISTDICKQITAELPPEKNMVNLWRLTQERILAHLPHSTLDLVNAGGVVVLVGPTGVGKTTTIAKLAARYTLRHGADKVGLITTDSYRVAAKEQLTIYGNILKIPVLSANNKTQFENALYTLSDRQFVLIDTAGMSQREITITDRLSMLTKDYGFDLKTCLVLAANAQGDVMEEVVARFKHIKIDEVILTKVDEAVTLGSAISTLIRHQLPVSYFSIGQRVPEDLQRANPVFLINKAIETLSLEEVDAVPAELA